MKTTAALAFATCVLAVPSGKQLVRLELPGPFDYNPGTSLWPQRSVGLIGGIESSYTEETFRAEAVKKCRAEPACSTVIGYLQDHSTVVQGFPYSVWYGWLIGGARATEQDFHHSANTSHSFIYTINE